MNSQNFNGSLCTPEAPHSSYGATSAPWQRRPRASGYISGASGGIVLPSALALAHLTSMEPKAKKPCRAQAKCWCFTLNNPLEGETLDESVFDYCVVGEEVGGEEETRHFQGYVIFKKAKQLSALKKLLPRAHWEVARGTPQQNAAYCKKGNQSKQEWTELGVKGPNYGIDVQIMELGEIPAEKKIAAKKRNFGDALAAGTVKEGMDIIKEREPDSYLLHGEAIERNLKRAKVASFEKTYLLDTFNHAPLIFGSKATLVYGPTNCGKTSFVLAHFENPLVCSHIDKLKTLSPDNDAIVFDDMCFKHWPKEAIIHLLDHDLDREINVRYGTVSIPAKIIKVFTHNSSNPFYDDEIEESQKEAIERRLNRIHIVNKLY